MKHRSSKRSSFAPRQKLGKQIETLSEEELAIFGLTEAESNIVLGLIEYGPIRISKLSRETNLPHTTVHAAIRRLRDQGLVRRVSKGYSSVWEIASVNQLRKRLKKALKPFNLGLSRGQLEAEIGVKVSDSTDFFIFNGIPEILKFYQWFFLNHRNERVCSIQSSSSINTIYRKLDVQSIAGLNGLLKANKIVTETVFPESIKDFYKEKMAENKAILASIEEHTAPVRLIPEQFLNLNADIGIAQDVAFLTNWEAEVSVFIKNPDMVALLRNLFEFLKHTGEVFDQKRYVRRLIEEKQK